MELKFTITPPSLPEARAIAQELLDTIQAGGSLDRINVAKLCSHVIELKRKTKNDGTDETDE